MPLRWASVFHSGYADDRNDGALFGGRGLSTEVGAGAEARWRWLSLAAAPLAIWQENRAYDVPAAPFEGYSPFANPFNLGNIDLPTRFGPDAFWTLHPGQSYARLDAFGVALGFSSESLWWGPGQRNSLLLSNTAGGFPHLFLGTSRAVNVWIGWLEAEMFWGRVHESGWFDSDRANDRRLLTAVALSFEPRPLPNLHLGLLRVYDRVVPPGGFSFGDYFTPITEPFFKSQVTSSPGSIGEENQLLSLTLRWAFPEAGLELYGEYGRDDHSWDFQDFAMEPGHAAAWLAGAQKVIAVRGRRVRLLAEAASTFEKPAANETRPTPIFYTHSFTRPGYTHRGQMLGAGIGPQAESQFLAADLLTAGGRFGLYLERVLRNERYFWDRVAPAFAHDVELAAGLRQVHRWRGVDLEWELGRAFRWNANFSGDAVNWNGRLAVAWHGPAR
jgi:hypothetical protein